jgi:molybdate transport system substrate-binding protein
MSMKFVRVAMAAGLAGLLFACSPKAEEKAATPAAPVEAAVKVAAASSLTDVLKKIGEAYAADGHPAPVFNFAASSELARQVEQGADADVFVSADEDWMNYLAERKLIDDASRKTLLTNTLVLIAPTDHPFTLKIEPKMKLKAALKTGKLAIGNPDSVPAGKYAKEALDKLGVWAEVDPQTARAENVRAALRFVETGEAAAGIVYGTDAKASGDKVIVVGEFPADTHAPITYPAAVIASKAGGPGKAFLDYLSSEKSLAVFRQAGFGVATP